MDSTPNNPPETARQFPCQSCGAKLNFAPNAAVLQCPYCSHENAIPQSEQEIQELDYQAQLDLLADQQESQEDQRVKCDRCGAETTVPANVSAGNCPFCAAPLVFTGQTRKLIKPQSLLPFQITNSQAIQLYRQWVNHLWFAPNDLKQLARSDQQVTGVYVPYWTYDCKTITFYHGQRGIDYYVTVGTGKNRHTVRRTRWSSVSGVVGLSFNDLLVLACQSLPVKYVQKLEPWDLENLTPYADEYLAGFRAQSYQVNLAEGFGVARMMMDDPIRQAICSDIGGDRQRIDSMRTQYNKVTFKHLLLPVWLSAYRYRDRIYRFVVNGRTGEVQGERPWSWIKITLTVLVTLAVAGAVAWIIGTS